MYPWHKMRPAYIFTYITFNAVLKILASGQDCFVASLAGFYTYEGHIPIQRNINWHEKNFNFISTSSNPRKNQRLSDVESVSVLTII
jgi:hypothetical protein